MPRPSILLHLSWGMVFPWLLVELEVNFVSVILLLG